MDVNAILRRCNELRAAHGAGPLSWDQSAANHAQSWANRLARQGGELVHSSVGENLASTTNMFSDDTSAALYAVKEQWYDEVALYDYGAPGFSDATGHFTYLVWRSSTGVGFGVAWRGRQCIVAARFTPSGNLDSEGEFRANVLPRGTARTAAQRPQRAIAAPRDSVNHHAGPAESSGGTCGWGDTSNHVHSCCQEHEKEVKELVSENGQFRFVMQSDGNVMLSKRKCAAHGGYDPLWWSNTLRSGGPWRLTMQGDGNLVAYTPCNSPFWASNTCVPGTGPFVLIMQDDGNCVIYNGANQPIWATNTCGR